MSDYSYLDGASEPRSRGRSPFVAAFVGAALALVAALLLFLDPLGWHGLDEALRGESPRAAAGDTAHDHAGETLYTCPMHPEILQEEPGACPICGMDLVPVDEGGDDADAAAEVETLYSCGMHPQILEDEPGLCPICGMDLTPVAASGSSAGEPVGSPGDASEVGDWTCPLHPVIHEAGPGECPICGTPLERAEGAAAVSHDDSRGSHVGPTVTLDPAMIQRMNVRTTVAERRRIAPEIRTVGVLEVDQETTATVTPRFAGWIESVTVYDVGERVRRGDVLVEVYAPELVQTQQELLSAARYAERLGDAPEATRERAHDLVDAARERLGYWQVTSEAIDRLLETGEVQRTVPVRAPVSGTVIERRDALEGQAVRAGDALFQLADLSTLWLTVDVHEDQLANLRPGIDVLVRFDAWPGETFTGRVRRLEPTVDAATRTLGVRIEMPNRDGRLRPGLYATATFDPTEEGTTDPVTVPAQAVLRTGQRDVVIVALGAGRFAPREVTLGARDGEYFAVTAGLEAGERIVTSAQFLIDSESNLRAAIEQMRSGRREASARESSSEASGSNEEGRGSSERSELRSPPAVDPDADHRHELRG